MDEAVNKGRQGIVIAGGGPVGLTMALALHQRGWAPQVLDVPTSMEDPRVLALSVGSQHILQWLKVWPSLTPTPIDSVAVHQLSASFHSLSDVKVTASDHGLRNLGYAVRAAELMKVLHEEATARGIEILHAPAREWIGQGMLYGSAEAPQLLPAELAIWASGLPVHAATKTPRALPRRVYAQRVMVGRLRIDKPLSGVAWELLIPAASQGGLLVLLPEQNDLAFVLVASEDFIAEKIALSEENFCCWLRDCVGALAGVPMLMACISRQVMGHTLQLRWRWSVVEPRQVWIGSAAQNVHPVGAQGLNLALRDVWELTTLIPSTVDDAGDAKLLLAYARGRRLDRLATIALTDTLALLTHAHSLSQLRADGLGVVARLPLVKSFLIHRMIWGAKNWLPHLTS